MTDAILLELSNESTTLVTYRLDDNGNPTEWSRIKHCSHADAERHLLHLLRLENAP